jgi:hypothetical protein
MKGKIRFGDRCSGFMETNQKSKSGIKVGGRFIAECYGKDGKLKWRDTIDNLVVTVGLQHILDVVFSAATQTDPWYVGLTDSTPTVAAGDIMTSHAGWVEITDYTGNRKAYVETRTAQTESNSSSKASFAINNTVTVGGAFLVSDDSGTAGILLCGGAFTGGDKSLSNGDTLNVQYDFSAADDGV